MILRRLSLRNFRRYRSAEIDFPEGLVGLIGPNGAGKSTIFEAVGWALYGNRLSRTGGFGLASRDAGDKCMAELVFERDGRTWRATRVLVAGGRYTQARVHEGALCAAADTRTADALLQRLAGLSARGFLRTLHARQGELAGLARDTPEYRRKIIDEILGWDVVDRARAQVGADLAGLEAGLRPVAPIADAIVDLERKSREAADALCALRQEKTAIEGIVREGDVRVRRHAFLRGTVELLEKQRTRLSSGLSRLGGSPGTGRIDGDREQARLAAVRSRRAALLDQSERVSSCLKALRNPSDARCPLCRGPLSPETRNRLKEENEALAGELRRLSIEERAVTRSLGEAARRARLEEDLSQGRERLVALDARLEEARRGITALGFDEAAHDDASRRLRTLAARVEDAASRAGSAQARLEEVRASSKRRAAALERAGPLRLLQDLLREFKARLAAGLGPALERECAGLLAGATGGRYARLFVDEDSNVRMEDGGRAYVLARFSGGEQDAACVALRLGLLRLATRERPVDFCVLDEVFGSQDRGRRRALLGALRGLCPPFHQVFVLTHAEDVQDLLPAVLRVSTTPDGSIVAAEP